MFRQQQRPADSETVASFTEDEAREILRMAGTQRRKRLRIRHGVQIGFFASLPLVAILALMGMVSKDFVLAWVTFGAGPLFWIFFLSPHFHHFIATTRQKEALKALIPHARLEDIAWLIEGSEYLEQETLRERIQEFLPQLSAHQATLLPEGARKILRRKILAHYLPLPFRITALETLLRIGDSKTIAVAQKLARREPIFPGEEPLLIIARQALRLGVSDLDPLILTTTEARDILQTMERRDRHRDIYTITTLVGFFVLTVGGLAVTIATNNPLGILIGFALLIPLFGIGFIVDRTDKPSLRRQVACLHLAEIAEKADLSLLIVNARGLINHTNHAFVFQHITTLLNQLQEEDHRSLTSFARHWLHEYLANSYLQGADWYPEFQKAAQRVLKSHRR